MDIYVKVTVLGLDCALKNLKPVHVVCTMMEENVKYVHVL